MSSPASAKSFSALFLLCVCLAILPLPPGQNLHGFIVPALFYYCATNRQSIHKLLAAVLFIAVLEYAALYLYYRESSIDPVLKQLLLWEKPFFILLLTASVFLLINKITIFIERMVLLMTFAMLSHYVITFLLLKFQGNYSYTAFVLAEFDLNTFYSMLNEQIPTADQANAQTVINWTLQQAGGFNIIINLIYAVILARLFFHRFVGIRNEIFLSFRLPKFTGIVFLTIWALALGCFFLYPTITQPAIAASLTTELQLTPITAPGKLLFNAIISLLLIISTLYSFQGLSCIAFFMRAFTAFRTKLFLPQILIIGGIFVAFSFIFSLERVLVSSFCVCFLLGICDQWRNFRGFKQPH